MNDLLQQLIGMGPGLGAAASGNGPAFAAFMEGYEQARQQAEQRKRVQQQDSIAVEDRNLALQDRQRGITRQQAVDTRATEDQQWQQEQRNLSVAGTLGQAASGAESVPEGEAAIDTLFRVLSPGMQEQMGGARDAALSGVQRTVTGRQKKQVEAYVKWALKTSSIADNPDADPEMTLPEHMQRIVGKPSAKLSELQSFAQLPVGKPAGKTRIPAAAGSFEDYVEKAYGPNATADQILSARKAYNQSDDRPRITVNTGGGGHPPAVQRRVDAVIKGFDAQPIVKRTQTMSEGVSFAQAMKDDTTNPSDDQALIYAFAKVMDPDSVVREGEYATVQKYSQSWAERFGFDVKRIFSNTAFLTPQARKNMKATLMTKFNVERKAYDNLRGEFGRRIDRIIGKPGGIEELTDYGAAFPQATSAATGGAQPGTGPKVGERRKVKGVLAEWDGTGWLPVKM